MLRWKKRVEVPGCCSAWRWGSCIVCGSSE
jgi:hypothetical protein